MLHKILWDSNSGTQKPPTDGSLRCFETVGFSPKLCTVQTPRAEGEDEYGCVYPFSFLAFVCVFCSACLAIKMAKKDKGPVHPAKKFFQIAAALMALALLLNFITFFVPWTMKKPNSTAHYSYVSTRGCELLLSPVFFFCHS